MKSLVLFGDSLFGRCRKGEETFLADKLNNQYEIYNCATGGLNSDDVARRAPFIGKLQPDVVLISVGSNDASPWKAVSLDVFKQNLSLIAKPFENSRIIFFPPPPIVESIRPEGKEIPNELMRQYNQAVVDYCQQNEVEYWDSWADMLPLLETDRDPHNEDGLHFSDEGYTFVLAKLAETIA
jgi:lysophospholipase L1-like esterase